MSDVPSKWMKDPARWALTKTWPVGWMGHQSRWAGADSEGLSFALSSTETGMAIPTSGMQEEGEHIIAAGSG